ncbi:MAG: GNAT family N-acetyltransferase [Chloroflexi bacterium]|nr:GNAT family N-acetyltransferase [Chloroflexota bacterium]
MAAKRLTFCPNCGYTPLSEREEGGRLRQACPKCSYIHYVNPVPVVGILIEMDGGVVLIKRANAPHKDEWTLPSGYIEADESAEEAAIREAEEETGLKVTLTELSSVNSFPEGPPTSGIMIFYRAHPIGGELRAGDDASEARVFKPEELPLLPFRTHREMIALWQQRQPAGANGAPGGSRAPLTPPEFSIRPATAADAHEVVALLNLIPAYRGMTREQWHEVVVRFREIESVQVFVAEANQQPPIIIGFVALSVVRALTEGRGLINDMAVLPTYQRRGVGTALLEAAKRHAQALHLNYLMVNTGDNPQFDLVPDDAHITTLACIPLS